MRILEILTFGTLLLAFVGFFWPQSRRPRWTAFLPGLTVLWVLAHLVLEGVRWQMVPAYAITGLTFLATVRHLLPGATTRGKTRSRGRRALTLIGSILGLLVLAVALAPPTLVPVFRLPEPTGPHAVGTRYFYWVDRSRPDTYTSDPDDYREVSVQAWYPAERTGKEKRIRYMSKEASRASAEIFNVPPFFLGHLPLVRTHAYLNAGPARKGAPYPIITYSTSGLMSSHMALFEELASHGYIVLCIGHPYWNSFVYGADGEFLPFDGQNEVYKAWWAEENDAVREAKEQITIAKTTAAQERAQRRHNELKPVAIRDLKEWAADVGLVLDELGKLNEGNDPWAGALDLERAGVMGFSKGGATAGQFCVTDARCKAGINLTGFMYGDIVDRNLSQPFLFFSEEELWCPDCYVNDLFFKRAKGSAYRIKVRGARHASFGDPGLWGRLLHNEYTGATIKGTRMNEIVNNYSLAFWNKHLRGLPAPLLDGPSPDYPEAVFKSHH